MTGQFFNKQLNPKGVTLCFSGDLVLDLPDGDHWLSGIAPILREADLTIGHVEVPHTTSKEVMKGDVPAPGAPVENLKAIADAGFDCVTLAGNHIADCGAQGIADTVEGLNREGVATCGAHADLNKARAPAILKHGALSVAVLSYNCVGPAAAWASEEKAGCAYLPVLTDNDAPVAPVSTIIGPDEQVLDILKQDIEKSRTNGADVVVVALHKGRVHTPALIEDYERRLTYLCVDAGADLVVGHHAHILRGMEFYKDVPIFHGLGNGCVVTEALSPGQDDETRAEWVERRKQLFGFEPDPAYTYAPFHPEAVNAMLAVVTVNDEQKLEAGFLPVFIEAPGRPVVAVGERRQQVIDYVADITVKAGLPALTLTDDGAVVGVKP